MHVCDCVFERPDLARLDDDEVLDHVARCGDCPALRSGAAQVLLARLRGSARELRRAGSRARQLARELAELRVEADRSEQRIANLERVQKISTRELLQKNAIFSMIASITLAASEAIGDEAVFRVCMHKLCAAAGWSLAQVHVVGGGGPNLWHVADAHAGELARHLPEDAPSELGREVLGTARPTWIPDLHAAYNAPWTEQAAALGLRAGAALPVLVDDQVVAVAEFYGTVSDGSSTAQLVAMSTIGAQLGRVLARHRAEEALAAARDAAEEASRAKSDFLASMSHELRTPLNAILGYTELVQEILGEREIHDLREDVRRIRQAGEHLLGLINNILDLSKVEAGRMPVVPERFDLEALIRDSIQLLDPLIERRDNTVAFDLVGDLSEVHTDPTLVRQILFNLISNAAKFTARGTITVTAAAEPGDDGQPWLRLAVADTGVGMSEDQRAGLFRPYRQVDPRRDRNAGTGLGLTLCAGLSALLGGTITVVSEPGRGSTFTVRLPLSPSDP